MINIAILGAAGFIGTNLTSALASNPDNALTLIDQDSEFFLPISAMKLRNARIRITPFTEDTDYDDLLRGMDVVYHLVSTTVPTTSNRNIPDELAANVVVSSKILDACVRCGIDKVIFFSSGGTVYGIESDCPLLEEMPTHPISSYGVQKLTIEKLLYLYRHMCGLDYRIMRLSNPYGPYQRPNGIQGVVTTFIYEALRHGEITVFGDGSIIRDFIYIDDAVRAVIKIAEGDSEYKIFNVGCGYGTSINQVLNCIRNILGVNPHIIYRGKREFDVPINYLDISRYEKAHGKLDPISLEQGIPRTAEFIRRQYRL